MVSCAWLRQKERHGATGEGHESLPPVERDGVFIFRIDDKREGRCFALESAERYVGKYGAAEPLALEALIDGKTTSTIRFTMRVRSPTSISCSRLGRFASSSSIVGIAAMLQWRLSPRSQPRNARINSSVSRRSVLARRCSRDTAMLDACMT